MTERPVIFYIDDEPQNLTVFEAALPDEWEVKVFDSPMAGLAALEKACPWVVVSDQRMPGTSGVEFLEMTRKLHPEAVRIIVTGYSDEDLVIESVRKAKVFDYIRKPWDVDDLANSIRRALSFYESERARRKLNAELEAKHKQLEARNEELKQLMGDLNAAKRSEETLRRELECWAPPFVRWAVGSHAEFPEKIDIVGITFDIIGSSKLHGVELQGKSVRSHIIHKFTECILRHGGWRESHSGDSAYGYFVVREGMPNPFEAALAVASEFRVSLRSLSRVHGSDVEVGIALHFAKSCAVDVHTVQIDTPSGLMTQKSFDTSSLDIDLLHRMEKLVHKLPGSNIILTGEFFDSLKGSATNISRLGILQLAEQNRPVELYIIKSDRVSDETLKKFIHEAGIDPSPANLSKAA